MPLDQTTYYPKDEILDPLIKARGLIANRENWIAGERHSTDNGVDQYCALGAIEAAASVSYICSGKLDNGPIVRYLARFSKVPQHYPASAVACHNNELGHKATLEMFDNAVEARRAELMALAAV